MFAIAHGKAVEACAAVEIAAAGSPRGACAGGLADQPARFLNTLQLADVIAWPLFAGTAPLLDMPISREQAEALVAAYAERHGAVAFEADVVELDDFWFFPVGYVGSRGVIVDRLDGRLSVLGSAPSLSLDDCFWGHRRGFSDRAAILTITRVTNLERAREFLFDAIEDGPPRTGNPWPRRGWLENCLARPPVSFGPGSYWLLIPGFRAMEADPPFEWTVTPVTEPSEGKG